MHLPHILCSFAFTTPGVLAHLTVHPAKIQLASFGVGDSLFLLIMALIVFGPKKLPEISRQLGKLVYEFRRASNDFKLQIEDELQASERAERQKQLANQSVTPQPATAVSLSATEEVTAANDPAVEGAVAQDAFAGAAEPATSGEPTIMPPSTGEQVSSLPPNRFREYAEGVEVQEPVPIAAVAVGSVPPDGVASNGVATIEEMQVAAREADVEQSESVVPVYAATTGESAATHHG